MMRVAVELTLNTGGAGAAGRPPSLRAMFAAAVVIICVVLVSMDYSAMGNDVILAGEGNQTGRTRINISAIPFHEVFHGGQNYSATGDSAVSARARNKGCRRDSMGNFVILAGEGNENGRTNDSAISATGDSAVSAEARNEGCRDDPANLEPWEETEVLSNVKEDVHLLFLEAEPLPRQAGMGHTFGAFHHFVQMASAHGLSIRANFTTRGHGVPKGDVRDYFFGNLTMTPLPDNATCSRRPYRKESIAREVAAAQRSGACVVFEMKGTLRQPVEEGMAELLPYYRRMFERNGGLARGSVRRRRGWGAPPARVPGRVRTAVHIRRGDLPRFFAKLSRRKNAPDLKPAVEGRLVDERAYAAVLTQLLGKLADMGEGRAVEVRLYCEGMVPPASVPGALTWDLVDLSAMVSYGRAVMDVTFLPGWEDPFRAFDEMCSSDVLVTGLSGFSKMVGVLCDAPVILGMPMGNFSEYVPNAVALDVGRMGETWIPSANVNASIINRAAFDEGEFERLWKERHSL